VERQTRQAIPVSSVSTIGDFFPTPPNDVVDKTYIDGNVLSYNIPNKNNNVYVAPINTVYSGNFVTIDGANPCRAITLGTPISVSDTNRKWQDLRLSVNALINNTGDASYYTQMYEQVDDKESKRLQEFNRDLHIRLCEERLDTIMKLFSEIKAMTSNRQGQLFD